MPELSERHAARVVAAFCEVEACLSEALCALGPAALQSPFARRLRDVTPVQQRLVSDYADHVRSAMREILDRYGIALPLATESARVIGRAALDHATIAIEELGPRYMCAYGALSDEQEGELNRVVSRLLDVVAQVRGFLAERKPDDLRERLQGLSERLPQQRLLGELEEITSAHDLPFLRARLEALIERFERNDLEIAVFGRVNSGKSSLLNYLLDASILPVGTTPVTAVPVYLGYGTQPWGFATFADATPEKFALGRLPEFAAEHFNPTNLRHVMHLRVELPAPQLKDGITLVDMPGRAFAGGNHAVSVAGITPCCDVGVVLIDAAAGLTLEEAVIIDALDRAGSSVLVLLTKADLLRSEERWKVQGHVSRGLSAMTGRDVPVYFASTIADDAALRSDWLERGLRPLLQQRDQLRHASLQGKLNALCEAVCTALERRLSIAGASPASPNAWHAAEADLAHAQALLHVALEERFDAVSEAEKQTAALINEVAHNAAVLWPQSHEPRLDITTLLTESLRARATGVAKTAAKSVEKLKAQCSVALAGASAVVGIMRAEATDLPSSGAPPIFSGTQCIAGTVLPQPALAFLGRRRRAAGARKWLARSALRARIAAAMTEHFARVEQWRLRALKELSDRFATKSTALEARYREISNLPRQERSSDEASIAAAIDKLRQLESNASRSKALPQT